MGKQEFSQIAAPINPIHDLKGFVGPQRFATILQPMDERLWFRLKPEATQSVQGKTSVSDPGVTVIPVSSAADLFWQTLRFTTSTRTRGLGFTCNRTATL